MQQKADSTVETKAKASQRFLYSAAYTATGPAVLYKHRTGS